MRRGRAVGLVGHSCGVSVWLSWDEWLNGLDGQHREQATRLRDTFARLGADDPESWVRSEVSEDFAQLASFLVLRSLWRDAINMWSPASIGQSAVASRLLEHGADIDDLVTFARAASYQAVFGVLYLLTAEHSDPELADTEDGLPGWRLMELRNGVLTGRGVDMLHESILSMDPSGNEGQDLFE